MNEPREHFETVDHKSIGVGVSIANTVKMSQMLADLEQDMDSAWLAELASAGCDDQLTDRDHDYMEEE